MKLTVEGSDRIISGADENDLESYHSYINGLYCMLLQVRTKMTWSRTTATLTVCVQRPVT